MSVTNPLARPLALSDFTNYLRNYQSGFDPGIFVECDVEHESRSGSDDYRFGIHIRGSGELQCRSAEIYLLDFVWFWSGLSYVCKSALLKWLLVTREPGMFEAHMKVSEAETRRQIILLSEELSWDTFRTYRFNISTFPKVYGRSSRMLWSHGRRCPRRLETRSCLDQRMRAGLMYKEQWELIWACARYWHYSVYRKEPMREVLRKEDSEINWLEISGEYERIWDKRKRLIEFLVCLRAESVVARMLRYVREDDEEDNFGAVTE
ncbi:hypothetical protein BJ508DRAFT_76841 [Ascobolus immersus RN42]|uniref:Uncharacterized protein n=1 Tax=Ascobolus immersus RN42 TaxID=1160509 RepID=A0A3N4HHJ9_ASCIM|nr:hypothetical protein BJ508DRAFT_76841 [Ascobolus immersus RN42]